MPSLRLVAPCSNDVDELLEFEVENREYFEANVNARSADFYTRAAVSASIEAAVRQANDGTAFQYLVKGEGDEIIGRVNLTRVRRAHYHSANLGYRIAQSATGQGFASEAVRAALDLAFAEKKLRRIEAIARPENLASIAVLRRNGFVQFGRSSRSFELHGTWYDRVYFERHVEDAANSSTA